MWEYLPSQEQVLGWTRNALAAVGGYLIGRGTVSVELWTALSGLILAIIPLAWTLQAHMQKRQVAVAAAVISSSGDRVTAQPVINALREVGAHVDASSVPFDNKESKVG